MYSWGRGYHGQLGHKDHKNVQWTPKKVKIRKDPRLKDEDQPNRFSMISCGEKHTLALAVNGLIWFSGDKAAVGQFLKKDESKEEYNQLKSYQYTFMPLFSPADFVANNDK